MKFAVATVAAFAAAVFAQEQPSPAIPAPGSAPPGCVASYSGTFGISNTLLPGASAPSKRTPPSEGVGHALYLTLTNGILYDSDTPPRFGYIAANEQLQFDNPIQAGGIYTEGWSLCPNNTLGFGDTTVFFQCQSGEFYNIYYTAAGANCIPIELTIVPASGGAPVESSAPAATSTDVYQVTSSAISAPVYTTSAAASSSSPVVVSSSSAVVTSSSAAASSSKSTPPPTTTAAPSSSSVAPSSSSFTGAAPTMGVDSSFFAVAAGAVAMAMF